MTCLHKFSHSESDVLIIFFSSSPPSNREKCRSALSGLLLFNSREKLYVNGSFAIPVDPLSDGLRYN